MRKLWLLAALAALLSCASEKKQDEGASKALVIYYSQTGATRAVAEELQKQLCADIEAIEAVEAYDGDFQATIQRSQQERAEGVLPEIKPVEADLSQYDVIFIGYPVWFGTFAPPVESFIKNYDLSGKRIITFCTFGSGGLDSSTADMQRALPDADVVMGYGVRNARIESAPAEIEYFLKSNKLVEGEVDLLPDYSALQPVSEEEIAIYDAACGDYPMLHAQPVRVGKAATAAMTYYLYEAEENGQMLKVKVQVGNEEGAKPEFTEVLRAI